MDQLREQNRELNREVSMMQRDKENNEYDKSRKSNMNSSKLEILNNNRVKRLQEENDDLRKQLNQKITS